MSSSSITNRKSNNSPGSGSTRSSYSRFNTNTTTTPSSSGGNHNKPSQLYADKVKRIRAVLSTTPEIDLWQLRALAVSEGGFVNDSLRRKAWPKLVGLHERVWNGTENTKTNPRPPTSSQRRPPTPTTMPTPTSSRLHLLRASSDSIVSEDVDSSSNKILNNATDTVEDVMDDSTTPKASNNSFHHPVSSPTTATIENVPTRSEAVRAQEIFQSEVGGGNKNKSFTSSPSSMTSPRRSPRFLPQQHPLRRVSSGGSSSLLATIQPNSSFSDVVSVASSTHSTRDTILASSLDWQQIDLDAARCTWHLLTGSQRIQRYQMEHKRMKKVARAIRRKQRRLANLINLTLVQSYKRFSTKRSSPSSPNVKAPSRLVEKDNTLRYYQGYHDVACIVLSTLSGCRPVRLSLTQQQPSSPASGTSNNSNNSYNTTTLEGMAVAARLELPAAVLLQLSQSHFRDCMRANFMHLQTALRLTMLPLLAYFDPEIHDCLQQCGMEPFFALSWVITWFSHDIRDTDLVKRLFDFFLVSHPLMPIYLSVAMVCHPLNRQDVLQCSDDGDDFAAVHHALSSLPRNSSMVGWKYKPGDGYVSDEGDDDDLDDDMDYDDDFDDMSPSFDSQSSVDTEFLRQEAAQFRHGGRMDSAAGAEAVSTVSSSLTSMYPARVPFQELIDTAIHYMDRMPPHSLLGLATRYYGRDAVEDMLHTAPGISFFQPPPPWTRASKVTSDNIVRQHRGDEMTPLVQNGSASSLPSTEKSGQRLDMVDADRLRCKGPADIVKRLRAEDRGKALAAIAAGLSLGDDAERRRKKYRKRIMIGATAAVVVVAVIVGIFQSRTRRQGTLSIGVNMGKDVAGEKLDFSRDSGTCNVVDVPVATVPATCSRSSESMVVMATSTLPSVEYRRSIVNNVGSMAMNEDFVRDELFQLKSTNIAVSQTVSPPSTKHPKDDERSGIGGDVAFSIAHPPHLDVLLTVVFRLVFQEALLLSDRIQRAGRATVMPRLKSIAAQSKEFVGGHHLLLGIPAIHVIRPDVAVLLAMLKDGLDRGAAQVKDTVHDFCHVLNRKSWKLLQDVRSAASLAANDYMESGDVPSNTQSLANTPLRVLEQEIDLQNLTKAVRGTLDQAMRNLIPALQRLQATILSDMKKKLQRASDSGVAQQVLRQASPLNLYDSPHQSRELTPLTDLGVSDDKLLTNGDKQLILVASTGHDTCNGEGEGI